MLQSWSEQPSSSSGVWHSFPQPVAGQLSETQLYSELLPAPKKDEEGREEGRRKGRKEREREQKGGRRGRGEEYQTQCQRCTSVLQNPYNTRSYKSVDSTFVLLAISLAETAGVALLGTEASSSFFFSSVFSTFTPSNSFLASSCSVRNLRPTSRS